VVVVSACSSPDLQSTQIAVPANDVGVVELEVTHFDEAGNTVTVVRGLSAAGDEIAAVRRVRGSLPELAKVLPSSNGIGSQITLSAQGEERRVWTASSVLRIDPGMTSPAMASFLMLPTVTETLTRDAAIEVFVPPNRPENSYFTWTCSSSSLLVTPMTYQCCEDESKTAFARADGNLVYRWKGWPCTDQGGGSCDGDACFYGPYGFARADIWSPGGYPYVTIFGGSWPPESSRCYATGTSEPQSPIFGDVQGENQPAGCPSNGNYNTYSYD